MQRISKMEVSIPRDKSVCIEKAFVNVCTVKTLHKLSLGIKYGFSKCNKSSAVVISVQHKKGGSVKIVLQKKILLMSFSLCRCFNPKER